jgi:hypothetical protein
MRTRSVLAALAAPVFVAGAALAASAGPALAAQSNIKIPAGAQIDLGPAAPCAVGDIVITVQSGHDNATGNPITGPYHENATIVGTAALVDPLTGNVLEQGGHANAWFTTNINSGGTVVNQDFVHAQFPSGRIDLSGKFTLNANGVPVVNNQRASCN